VGNLGQLLLEFVQISFEGGNRTDEMDSTIFENVIDSLFEAGRNIEKKARDEAYGAMLNHAATAAGTMLADFIKIIRSAEPKKTPAAA
jgi:hypothetical protein